MIKNWERYSLGLAAFLFSAAFLSLGGSRQSHAVAECPERHETVGNANIQQLRLRDGRCSIMVSSNVDGGDISRTYTFSSNGLILVFNTFGSGPSSRDTGSRSYFLFPRRQGLSFEVTASGHPVIHLPSGYAVLIDRETVKIGSIPGVTYSEDPAVNRVNNGGLNITRTGGVVLDTGWLLGEAAYSRPARRSRFIDPFGATCEMANSEIFLYGEMGKTRLKFDTDAGLAALIRGKCPTFDITPLVSRTWTPSPATDAGSVPTASPAPETLPSASAGSAL